MRKTSQDELDEVGDSLKTLPYTCGFTELFAPQCTSADSSITLLPLTPRSVRARVQAELCQTPLPPPPNVIVGFGETFLKGITPTVAQKELVETKTRKQAVSLRWHEEHFGRLTASNFGRVLLRKSAFDKLGCDLHSKDLSNVAAIRWGREHEHVAFDRYAAILPQRHRNLKLCKAGFYIGEPGYLGASPDGVLFSSSRREVGILEIKCPYSASNLTILEACQHCQSCNEDGSLLWTNLTTTIIKYRVQLPLHRPTFVTL